MTREELNILVLLIPPTAFLLLAIYMLWFGR